MRRVSFSVRLNMKNTTSRSTKIVSILRGNNAVLLGVLATSLLELKSLFCSWESLEGHNVSAIKPFEQILPKLL